MCKVEDCNRGSMYASQDVCQMHYFRYMRNGYYGLKPEKDYKKPIVRGRKYRLQNPAGYQSLHEPNHPLADKTGYVYEHRFVIYRKLGEKLKECSLCGKFITWKTCHIDHIDEDVTNNIESNLRPTCNPCNTRRNKRPEHEYDHILGITIDGVTKTAGGWAKTPGVYVSGSTISRRIKAGFLEKNAVFDLPRTHKVKTLIVNIRS